MSLKMFSNKGISSTHALVIALYLSCPARVGEERKLDETNRNFVSWFT